MTEILLFLSWTLRGLQTYSRLFWDSLQSFSRHSYVPGCNLEQFAATFAAVLRFRLWFQQQLRSSASNWTVILCKIHWVFKKPYGILVWRENVSFTCPKSSDCKIVWARDSLETSPLWHHKELVTHPTTLCNQGDTTFHQHTLLCKVQDAKDVSTVPKAINRGLTVPLSWHVGTLTHKKTCLKTIIVKWQDAPALFRAEPDKSWGPRWHWGPGSCKA